MSFLHCISAIALPRERKQDGNQAGLRSVLGRQEQTQQADREERAQSDFPQRDKLEAKVEKLT